MVGESVERVNGCVEVWGTGVRCGNKTSEEGTDVKLNKWLWAIRMYHKERVRCYVEVYEKVR